jgi:hypothetical protein
MTIAAAAAEIAERLLICVLGEPGVDVVIPGALGGDLIHCPGSSADGP